MRERVESIGGSFAIVSQQGRTQVLADIPGDAIRRFDQVERRAA